MRPRAGRALTPSGIILVDKPAGPTSFAIVAAVRRRTGARTGHAGTLDPFATGLLLILSGEATKLQPRFVGLDKRYLTEIDLGARTTTGDPEGEIVDVHEPPSPDELEERLAGLQGVVGLPIPAASAVKIDGERAYRLHRRGVVVEMPVRQMTIHELELLGYEDGIARVDLLVSSGTYVRSIAEALGGHCRALRRTEIGPFSVDESDPEHDPCSRRGARQAGVKVVRGPEEVERRPRAVAIGTFDGVHRGHQAVLDTVVATGLAPTVITFDPHPRIALGNRVELLTTLERRLELLAEAGIETTVVAAFVPELQRLAPEEFAERYLVAIGVEVVVAGEDFRFGVRRSGDLGLLERLGFQTVVAPEVDGVSSTDVRSALAEGDVASAAAMLGRPFELDGTVVAGDQRGGTLGFPTANLAVDPQLHMPALRHLRGIRARPSRGRVHRDEPPLRRDRAADRALPSRLRGRPLRQAAPRRALGAAA